MLAMIDNYDSFTYNLVQYLGELGQEVRVFRNDAITPSDLAELSPKYLVVSPGPATPDRAGISLEVIRHFSGRIPILGVCLGHQSIGQAFGGRVVHAKQLMHGKTSRIEHNGNGIFAGIANAFQATRYHSLVLESTSLPDCFECTATTDEQEIMAIRHKQWPIDGVQFHPESILTEHGHTLLRNFLTQ